MLDPLLPATKANNRRNSNHEKFQARPARYRESDHTAALSAPVHPNLARPG